MRFKNKWLNRMTAAVLSIGMALTPAMMNSSVTYADVKNIESPIPVTQSEKAANLLKKTVVLSGSDYEISAEINATQMDIKVADSLNLSITLTAIPGDETSSNAIKTALIPLNGQLIMKMFYQFRMLEQGTIEYQKLKFMRSRQEQH